MTLFRMLELSAGSITVDDIDLSGVPRHFVRSRINGLPQDPFFLSGTIRLNIDPTMEKSDSEIIEVLEKVKIWEVIKMSGGLDTEMDSDSLSHGQKQLFCLARAILRPSSIVVLDEATSR